MRSLLVLLASCGTSDPCDGKHTCVTLDVASATVKHIDQVELDILYGDVHATVTTQNGTHTTDLPLQTAIVLDISDDVSLGVVAAGKLGGNVLGTAAGQVAIGVGEHAKLTLDLTTPTDCTANQTYCGGNLVVGDPNTVYQCNSGGVPIAHGVCKYGCLVRPKNDICRGGGGTCQDTPTAGVYCGGDKLDGDPSTLYTCSAGSGVMPVPCANGCMVNPPGKDDACR